jgi:hypothetical protein
LRESVIGQIAQNAIHTNPSAVLTALQTLPVNKAYMAILGNVFAAWGSEDPKSAIAAATSLQAGRNHDLAVQSALQGWASVDPREALAWADTLPEGLIRNQAVSTAITALAQQDPQQALNSLAFVANVLTRNSLTVKVVADWAQDDPKAAVNWVQQNTFGYTQNQALTAIMDPLSKLDPQAAANLLTQMPSGDGSLISSTKQISQNWAELDPVADLNWLKYLNDASGTGAVSAVKSALEVNVVSIWANNNPNAALAYVESLGSADPQFDKLIAAVASSAAAADPVSAAAWLQSLPDDGTRSAALNSVVNQLITTNPQEALQLATQMSAGPEQDSVYSKIISTWSATDPAAASDSLSVFPPGPALTSAAQNVAANWIQADPTAAANWIKSLPPGDIRDIGASEEAKALVTSNPSTAFAWATSIGNLQTATQRERSIIQVWGRSDPAAATAAVQAAPNVTELARTRMLSLIQRNNPAQQ